MSESETITILKAHYQELVEDSRFLKALQAAGVDNWEGYSYAFDYLDEEED